VLRETHEIVVHPLMSDDMRVRLKFVDFRLGSEAFTGELAEMLQPTVIEKPRAEYDHLAWSLSDVIAPLGQVPELTLLRAAPLNRDSRSASVSGLFRSQNWAQWAVGDIYVRSSPSPIRTRARATTVCVKWHFALVFDLPGRRVSALFVLATQLWESLHLGYVVADLHEDDFVLFRLHTKIRCDRLGRSTVHARPGGPRFSTHAVPV
jgi:hypothetical protein